MDDDDVVILHNAIRQTLPEMLTLYVVNNGGYGGNPSSANSGGPNTFYPDAVSTLFPDVSGSNPYGPSTLFPTGCAPSVNQSTFFSSGGSGENRSTLFPYDGAGNSYLEQKVTVEPDSYFVQDLKMPPMQSPYPYPIWSPELSKPLWEVDMAEDVFVAAEILNIPEDDDNSDSEDIKPVRNSFWGMPDTPPCPDPVIKSRQGNISYQPTSHVKVLQTFDSNEALKLAVGLKCVHENFQMKVKKSFEHRYEVVYHSDSDYDWCLMAVSIDGTSIFQVRKLHDEHTCSRSQVHPNHRNANKKVLGHILAGSLKDYRRVYRGKEIMEDVNQRFNISFSYHQAWRAKMYALQLLRGTPESSFNLPSAYCHNLKLANPETVTEIALDPLGRFDMLFVALGCSIRSCLGHMRPLLIMDGAHLKGSYVVTMFLAVGIDGNNGIVPIAMGVGKTESGPSWTWFLCKLRQCIGDVPNLTFITDRAASINLAIRTVFPSAHHGLCCRYLSQNFRLNSTKEKRKRWMFWEACKANRLSDFEATMDLMQHNLPRAAQYLEEVGYARWARSHFPGLRYNAMTSNSAESINSVTRFACYLPITMLVEFYRATLQQWYFICRHNGAQMMNAMTPWAEAKLEKRIHRSANWKVYPISDLLFEVDDRYKKGTYIQDCGQFCSVRFNSDFYRATYEEEVIPLPPEVEYVLPNERLTVLPPPLDIQNSGRPCNRDRIPSRDEEPIVKTCSRCGQSGHFRYNCPSPMPAPRPTHGSSSSRRRSISRPSNCGSSEPDTTQDYVFDTYDLSK
ncbi:uncharacterized protein LOC112509081 [Cynara cardunculus var. scolymus]|uniref:uncharacterized protein LOC112509081 n=1 Tax=Cynara cardunculus var. scolymus TaxID=59895 RepID=UPI000D62790C|nr:uncharacterized protein LOC112509081 [Cynara cardunculus var. scolymus]